MAILRKATPDDFEKVYLLLDSIEGESHDKEKWRRIFSDLWHAEEGYCGYVLVDGDAVVGFLGMIFSRRDLGGRPVRVCNLSSWVVKEGYRSESLKLVMPLRRMKDYLLTNFTAREDVSFIFSKLGFKALDSAWIIIPPLPSFSSIPAFLNFRLSFRPASVANLLNSRDLAIYEDHKRLGCGHLVITGKAGYSYIVYHRCVKKGLPFAFIDYISDPELFASSLGSVRLALPARAGAVGIIVHERLLSGSVVPMAFRKDMQTPSQCLYTPQVGLSPEKIDNLYSELVLLEI